MTGEIESNKKLCWKVSDVDEISIHEWKHRCKLRCYFSIILTKLKLRILTMKVFTIRFPTKHPFFYLTFWNLMKLQIQHDPTSDKRKNNSSKRRLFEICFKWLIIQTQLFKLVYIIILKRHLKKQLIPNNKAPKIEENSRMKSINFQ